MQDWTDFFRTLADREPEVHADDALRDLSEILAHLPEEWTNGLLARAHEEERGAVREVFLKEPGLAQLVKEFHDRTLIQLENPSDLRDPLVLSNLASLLTQLRADYGETPCVPQRLVLLLDEALAAACRALLDAVPEQVEALRVMAQRVLSVLETMGMRQRRVILVELPVGNSIPTKMLHELLVKRGFDVHLLRIALSRNNSLKQGVRRKDLLERKLAEFPAASDDLFVYCDEWCSGANFAAISDFLARLVKKRPLPSFFFPIGLLSDEVRDRAKHASNVRKHDEALALIGLRGDDFRILVPPRRTRFRGAPHFFWAERDRMAGYRKMQIYGSIFSSLDETVNLLATDSAALEEARMMLFAQSARDGVRITTDVVADVHAFRAQFETAYADYLEVREALEKLEHESHNEDVDDVDRAIRELIDKMIALTRGRPAYLCHCLAGVYNKMQHRINPSDRYFFEAHAPVVSELEGDRALMHRHVMRELMARIGLGLPPLVG